MKLSLRGSAAILILTVAVLAGCAKPPQPRPGQVLRYGTPGVESYLPPGDARTLGDLQLRCRAVPVSAGLPAPQTLEAACDQLRRTAGNQPGNSLAGRRPRLEPGPQPD